MGQMKLSIFIFGVFSSLDWSKSVEIKYIFSPFSRSQNSLQEKEDNEAGKRGWECVMNRIEYNMFICQLKMPITLTGSIII